MDWLILYFLRCCALLKKLQSSSAKLGGYFDQNFHNFGNLDPPYLVIKIQLIVFYYINFHFFTHFWFSPKKNLNFQKMLWSHWPVATSDHTISCNRLWQKMLVRLDLDLRKNYPVKMSKKMKNCPFLYYKIFFSSLFIVIWKFQDLCIDATKTFHFLHSMEKTSNKVEFSPISCKKAPFYTIGANKVWKRNDKLQCVCVFSIC